MVRCYLEYIEDELWGVAEHILCNMSTKTQNWIFHSWQALLLACYVGQERIKARQVSWCPSFTTVIYFLWKCNNVWNNSTSLNLVYRSISCPCSPWIFPIPHWKKMPVCSWAIQIISIHNHEDDEDRLYFKFWWWVKLITLAVLGHSIARRQISCLSCLHAISSWNSFECAFISRLL